MWWLILILEVCSPHWIAGTEIERDNLIIYITEKDGNIKSLVSAKTVSGLNNEHTVNLSALEIDMIEDGAFSELRSAESLNLENNRLRQLNFSLFSNLPNLTNISVAHNYITNLAGVLVGSPNLKYLNLSCNNITNLTESNFDDLPQSLEMTMDKKKLINMPSANGRVYTYGLMYFLPWLQHLVIDRMYRRRVSLERLHNTESIFVKLCKTDDDTVESVKVVTNMESFGNCLSISENSSMLPLSLLGLRKFQHGWYQIPDKFKIIDLSSNNMTEITPELLNNLPYSIKIVDLSENNVMIIKNNIIDNKFLGMLHLGWNCLGTIEAGAFEKTNLHSLFLHNNALTSMEFVRTLPASLEYLDLSYNNISEIPNDSFVHLTALKHFKIFNNRLSYLPVGIFRGLKELQYLNIGGNYLQTIQAGMFDDNENLVFFEATHASIENLEDGVFKNLKNLKMIDLTRNKIKKVSRNTFSGLRTASLYMIELESNDINTIEEGSFNNMTIHALGLIGNPLEEGSVTKGAFESLKCSIVALPNNLYRNELGCINFPLELDFCGVKIQYLLKNVYVISYLTEALLYVQIQD